MLVFGGVFPIPYNPCMAYLPTFTISLPLKTTIHVGIYTSPMDPMGIETPFLGSPPTDLPKG